jgi:uncharacterized membrane protein
MEIIVAYATQLLFRANLSLICVLVDISRIMSLVISFLHVSKYDLMITLGYKHFFWKVATNIQKFILGLFVCWIVVGSFSANVLVQMENGDNHISYIDRKCDAPTTLLHLL